MSAETPGSNENEKLWSEVAKAGSNEDEMLVSNEDEKFGWIRSDEEEDLERISRPDAEDEGEHKKPRGRPFSRGRSGNPAGRPAGARNRTTLAAEQLLDG